jgi:hypothetical protein
MFIWTQDVNADFPHSRMLDIGYTVIMIVSGLRPGISE